MPYIQRRRSQLFYVVMPTLKKNKDEKVLVASPLEGGGLAFAGVSVVTFE